MKATLWYLDRIRVLQQYLLALGIPLLITAVLWPLHGHLSAANLALVYTIAVIFVAVSTGTRPALTAALFSFLALNFSFTEPRGTLFILHRQDMFTAGLFLVTAMVVGQLAARAHEQIVKLQQRERFNDIQLIYLERLSAAINADDVLETLGMSMLQVSAQGQQLLSRDSLMINAPGKIPSPPDSVRTKAATLIQHFHGRESTVEATSDTTLFLLLHDGNQAQAVYLVGRDFPGLQESARLLWQQANLALSRIGLAEKLNAERLAREQEQMRSSLLSSVSHDFRTPLTAMVGAASTVLELGDQLQPREKEELLGSILMEARRLNSYTQKLLDMTRLGKGDLTVNRTTIAIDEILHVVLKRLRQQFPAQAIDLQLGENLPLLQVHPALIEQALYNVLENACKFTGDELPIQISCRTAPASMIIDIEDCGPGIPDADQEKVFEMFHSADRGDRRAAGSGLGLAICRGMIGAHGGAVQILHSEALGGCLVRIQLPTSTRETG